MESRVFTNSSFSGRLVDRVVVVPEGQGPGPVQEVDVSFAIDVLDPRTLGGSDGDGEFTRVVPRR